MTNYSRKNQRIEDSGQTIKLISGRDRFLEGQKKMWAYVNLGQTLPDAIYASDKIQLSILDKLLMSWCGDAKVWVFLAYVFPVLTVFSSLTPTGHLQRRLERNLRKLLSWSRCWLREETAANATTVPNLPYPSYGTKAFLFRGKNKKM